MPYRYSSLHWSLHGRNRKHSNSFPWLRPSNNSCVNFHQQQQLTHQCQNKPLSIVRKSSQLWGSSLAQPLGVECLGGDKLHQSLPRALSLQKIHRFPPQTCNSAAPPALAPKLLLSPDSTTTWGHTAACTPCPVSAVWARHAAAPFSAPRTAAEMPSSSAFLYLHRLQYKHEGLLVSRRKRSSTWLGSMTF